MDDESIGAYVDAASAAVSLPIPAEFRQGVIANVGMIFAQSEDLLALHLRDDEEIGPSFAP